MIAIRYQLTLVEPLLVTAPGGDPNNDQSQTYVPGSVIRGALANRYLQNGQVADAKFTCLFLDGTVRFLNVYPVENGQRTLPTPKSWRVEKDPVVDEKKEEDNLKARKIHQFDFPAANKRVGGAFVAIKDGVVSPISTQYEVAIHTTRNRVLGRATKDDGAIFRYQALAPGQLFMGVIVVKNEEDAGIFQSLLPDTLILGGSNSAGYGLTNVCHKTKIMSWQEGDTAPSLVAGKPFTLYLTSDAILRHPKTGQAGLDIEAVLAEIWGANSVTVQSAYTAMGWVGGFNMKWGLPLPQAWAVQAGSVWQLTALRDISAAEVVGVINAGIGDRRAEGYGSLLINPN
ncbi:MAG: hypothetical protein KAG66_11195, partial [Methylococcales bacterium]|nr:hypothetical protein [Methylococcales bacterium]